MYAYPDSPSFSGLPVLLAHCLVTLRTATPLPVHQYPAVPLTPLPLFAPGQASTFCYILFIFSAFKQMPAFCVATGSRSFAFSRRRRALPAPEGVGGHFAAGNSFRRTGCGPCPTPIALLLPAPGEPFRLLKNLSIHVKKNYTIH